MSLEEKRINHLYKLLDEMEKQKNADAAAALRWAIFELERVFCA